MLLLSLSLAFLALGAAPAFAIHWDPLVEVTPSVPVDGTVTMKLKGQLDCSLSNRFILGDAGTQANCLSDDANLVKIIYGGIIVIDPLGVKHIWNGGDIEVLKGAETSITYGTFAADAALWSSSTTGISGRYEVDFTATRVFGEGKFFTDNRVSGFDVPQFFEVPEFALPAALSTAVGAGLIAVFRRLRRAS